jgi:hypothetical protein
MPNTIYEQEEVECCGTCINLTEKPGPPLQLWCSILSNTLESRFGLCNKYYRPGTVDLALGKFQKEIDDLRYLVMTNLERILILEKKND